MRYERNHYFATSPVFMTDNYTCCYTNVSRPTSEDQQLHDRVFGSKRSRVSRSTLTSAFNIRNWKMTAPAALSLEAADFPDALDGTTQDDWTRCFLVTATESTGEEPSRTGTSICSTGSSTTTTRDRRRSTHEGDWEMIQLRFRPERDPGRVRPDEVTYAQHTSGERDACGRTSRNRTVDRSCTWEERGRFSFSPYCDQLISSNRPICKVELLQDFVPWTDGIGSNTSPALAWLARALGRTSPGLSTLKSPEGPPLRRPIEVAHPSDSAVAPMRTKKVHAEPTPSMSPARRPTGRSSADNDARRACNAHDACVVDVTPSSTATPIS